MSRTQKALWLPAKQAPFELGEREVPSPGAGEVVVQIHATALNPVDWKIQSLGYPIVKDFPNIIGTDSAGIVEAVGEGVTTLRKGDRVLHQGKFDPEHATFQQYTICAAEFVAKLPENVSFDEGASIPLGLATAAAGFYNSKELGGMTLSQYAPGAGLTAPWVAGGAGKYKGQGALVIGGSSSVGQFAIQLARLSGFSPIVATSSLKHAAYLKELGATHVVDRSADIVAESKKIFSTPPSFVYDAISLPETQRPAFEALGPNGHYAIVLPLSEGITESDGKKVAHVFGNVHFQQGLGRPLYAQLSELLKTGQLKPNRVEVLPGGLNAIPAGLKKMENNQVSGVKLVVRPTETA